MLSPETEQALAAALDAVVKEAGHDPQYADLVASLTTAKDALTEIEAGEPEGPGEAADDAGEPFTRSSHDPHGFEAAKSALTARRHAPGA